MGEPLNFTSSSGPLNILGDPAESSTAISWRPEPTTRGTYEILKTCAVTFFLCVWRVVHLNVPEEFPENKSQQRPENESQEHPENESRNNTGKDRGLVSQIWHCLAEILRPHTMRQLKWMFIGILAPELIVFTAYVQWTDARRIKHAAKRASTATLTADHLSAAAGGIQTIRKKCWKVNEHYEKWPALQPLDMQWTMVHSFFAAMGGFVLTKRKKAPGSNPKTNIPQTARRVFPDRKDRSERIRTTLSPAGVEFLLNDRFTNWRQPLKETWILDQSKASAITKALIIGQAAFFCISIIARVTQRLDISLLELTTFAHSLCTLLTGLFWWSKPLNILDPVPIEVEDVWYDIGSIREGSLIQLLCITSDLDTDEGEAYLEQRGRDHCELRVPPQPPSNDQTNLSWRLDTASHALVPCELITALTETTEGNEMGAELMASVKVPPNTLVDRVRNFPDMHHRGFVSASVFLGPASLLYAGIHLLAWNASFFTNAERTAWRVLWCCVALTGFVISCEEPLKSFMKRPFPGDRRREQRDRWFQILRRITWGTNGLIRLFLLVECFLNLFQLQESAYGVVRWSQYLPFLQ